MPVVPILEDDDLDPSWLHDPLEYHGPPTPVWGTPEYDLGYEVNSSEAETEIDPTVQSSAGAPGAIMRLALRLIDPVTGIDEQTEQFRLLEAAGRIREAREARARNRANTMAHIANQINSPAHTADADAGHLQEMVDDVSLGEDLGEEDPLTLDPTQDRFLPPNLKEISSLASWQVSTCKPNCGVEALRSHSPAHFWQSDGPQPHLLTIHFHKWVKIVKLRVYLDFLLDESYTPTRMTFWGGTGLHDLIEFAEWRGEEPRGWADIDLDGCGPGGKAELRAFIVQVRVLENHQNGKDTHVRGVQVFARDEGQNTGGFGWERGEVPKGKGKSADVMEEEDEDGVEKKEPGWPSWMDDPVIR